MLANTACFVWSCIHSHPEAGRWDWIQCGIRPLALQLQAAVLTQLEGRIATIRESSKITCCRVFLYCRRPTFCTGLAAERGWSILSNWSSRGASFWQRCRGLKSCSKMVYSLLIGSGMRLRRPLLVTSDSRPCLVSSWLVSRLASCVRETLYKRVDYHQYKCVLEIRSAMSKELPAKIKWSKRMGLKTFETGTER